MYVRSIFRPIEYTGITCIEVWDNEYGMLTPALNLHIPSQRLLETQHPPNSRDDILHTAAHQCSINGINLHQSAIVAPVKCSKLKLCIPHRSECDFQVELT